ncbi:hypothetical protein AT15_05775 [Kosmotoga arenicorallina S304]|uniref:Histidinol-phosphatase n=1 Tax=Kosmotoga arenicorallina S304 TaxID=1453497 RepID=A0A176K3C0_9BACT|nr:histidinol-phosphatase HisJ family protein [Kosmotoga arenicorallina]OAA31582.1 hypothetical protein AT15_05775 [Kosmotoga arenicorallina S304]
MIDLHVHTRFSPDAEPTIEEVVEAAVKRDVKVLGISDHYELGPTLEEAENFGDPLPYLEEIERVSKEYPLKVLKAVELGIQSYTDNTILNGAFDYFIYSIHDGPNFPDNTEPKKLWKAYLEESIAAVETLEFPGFFGHLDFLRRYIPDYSPLEPSPLLDELLTLLVKMDLGLEINTSGLRKAFKEVNPQPWIIEKYLSFGGKYLTIGSDAHRTEDLGKGFDEALKIIKTLGVKEIFYCEDGNFISIPIETFPPSS